ncbi:hypothetical protein RDI58_013991 [Solanum bulbocastanum]|uniref:Uncharacterized protein n=1 Tax=Solanum bulbocastanum TaxID=147425 RepID=A0AAN8TUK0_SOLBU
MKQFLPHSILVKMAFRMSSLLRQRYLKSMTNAFVANRSFASSTAPRFSSAGGSTHVNPKKLSMTNGDMAPVYVLGGTLAVAIGLCIFTMKQQLFHGPGVFVTKKKRENLAEVDFPDAMASSGTKYIDKSVLRKFGRIQEPINSQYDIDPYTRPRKIESLKSVGA